MVENGDFWEQRIECMTRDELASLQLERLKRQVRRCHRESEFYRERLDAAGVGPDSIRNLGDLRKIPFVTKQELRDEQQAHPPFGRYARRRAFGVGRAPPVHGHDRRAREHDLE